MSEWKQGTVAECKKQGQYTFVKVNRDVGDGFFVVRLSGDVEFPPNTHQKFPDCVLNEKLSAGKGFKIYDCANAPKPSTRAFEKQGEDLVETEVPKELPKETLPVGGVAVEDWRDGIELIKLAQHRLDCIRQATYDDPKFYEQALDMSIIAMNKKVCQLLSNARKKEFVEE